MLAYHKVIPGADRKPQKIAVDGLLDESKWKRSILSCPGCEYQASFTYVMWLPLLEFTSIPVKSVSGPVCTIK